MKKVTVCVVLLALFIALGSTTGAEAKKKTADMSSDERYQYLFGTDTTYWTTDSKPKGYENKTAALSNMKTISVNVWRLSGKEKYKDKASLTVNAKLASEIKEIFDEIFELPEKFPVETLICFRWNTNGEVSGPFLENVTCMSAHAYGAAIDINYYQNDYYVGKNNDLRDKKNPYYITDSVMKIFEDHGWYWGGNYSICTDTMHFQYTGLEMLSYNNGSPFKIYRVKDKLMKGVRVKNVQRRLAALGYSCGGADGVYGKATAAAVKAFQKDYGLKVTGTTTKAFYIKLYNLTNEMYDSKY
ncbi:MAG: M15 family metallopeptidase [Lachnospiraceae bacterium]|nr:M15 family metallopeptidase [Lachnospiraceae bacterium]